MAPAIRSLFSSKLDSFFNANITSWGVLAAVCDSLHKYNLFHYLELWFRESIFPTYSNWKTIMKAKSLKKRQMIGFVFVVTIQACEWLKHVLKTFPPISSGPLLIVSRTL